MPEIVKYLLTTVQNQISSIIKYLVQFLTIRCAKKQSFSYVPFKWERGKWDSNSYFATNIMITKLLYWHIKWD